MSLPTDDHGSGGAALGGIGGEPIQQGGGHRHVVVATKLLLQTGELARELLHCLSVFVQRQQEVGDIAQLFRSEPQPVQFVNAERLEMAAALEHLRMLSRQRLSGETGRGLGETSEVFGRDLAAAPASRLDPAAKADQEARASDIREREVDL